MSNDTPALPTPPPWTCYEGEAPDTFVIYAGAEPVDYDDCIATVWGNSEPAIVAANAALIAAAPATARRLARIEEAARDAETLLEGIFADRFKPQVVEAGLERLRAALEELEETNG